MKTLILGGIIAASILLAGCSKKDGSSVSSDPTKKQQANAPSAAVPVTQPAMTAWQQGDKSKAITAFVEADWSARPLFASGSTLSLSEDQFKALSNDPDGERKANEIMPQISSLKQLGSAVAQAGRDAASKGDGSHARKCFTSLKQCGTALDSPNNLLIVQQIGRAFKKMAETELAKVTK